MRRKLEIIIIILLYIINLFYKGIIINIEGGESYNSYSIRFRFALISTPRPIRA